MKFLKYFFVMAVLLSSCPEGNKGGDDGGDDGGSSVPQRWHNNPSTSIAG